MKGLPTLKSRKTVTLTKPVDRARTAKSIAPEKSRATKSLFERLRELRKHLADERAVPPYIIFSDVALRQMARFYPAERIRNSRASAASAKKSCASSAPHFSREIAKHLQIQPAPDFRGRFICRTAVPVPRRSRLTDTVRETLHFFRQGKTVSEIARVRGFKDGTIYAHLEEAMLAGEMIDVNTLVSAGDQRDIAAAFKKHGFGNLAGVVESLGGKHGYGECRIIRAMLQLK